MSRKIWITLLIGGLLFNLGTGIWHLVSKAPLWMAIAAFSCTAFIMVLLFWKRAYPKKSKEG